MCASRTGLRLEMVKRRAVALALLSPLVFSGCVSIGYYAQLACGEYEVLSKREPIARLIADPHADAQLRARLQQAQQARRFASDHLALPRNGSYTLYADLGRRYVLWNVFAAPEFSLQPVTHCFPVAGCIAYRGYYSAEGAQTKAQALHTQGYETYVGGVPAYSTLGWFDDPILSTMLLWDDDELDGTVFHELAHQRLYVKGDTAFNESFASFVEREGLRQWRRSRGLPAEGDAGVPRDDQFTQLVMATRQRLEQLYASDLPAAEKRTLKQAEIERLRADYRTLRDTQWKGYAGYDGWMTTPINNAKLLPFGLYHRWIPAFSALFAQQRGGWPAFYAAARRLADLSAADREAALQKLAEGAAP
jgi:predicted aminopeptidase